MKPKVDWRTVDSPKKRTYEFDLFAFLLFTANKTNLFVRSSCFWFYLTFTICRLEMAKEKKSWEKAGT